MYIYKYVCIYVHIYCIYIYMIFITERLFELAIESCPEWNFKPRPLNSVQTL